MIVGVLDSIGLVICGLIVFSFLCCTFAVIEEHLKIRTKRIQSELVERIHNESVGYEKEMM